MTLRVLLAVTHLLGAGHLTRAAALARAFARSGHHVTLVSGGRPAPSIDTTGIRLVQLPPVHGLVADLRTLREPSGEPATSSYLGERRARLVAAYRSARPDVVVTELYPFGRRSLAAEFDALLAIAGADRPRPLVLCSLRDIVAPPSSAAKRDRTHAILQARYDAVLVHGDPALVPLDASWPLDPALSERVRYTGYIDGEDAPSPAPVPAGEIVVSGGSSAAALPLLRASRDAARLAPDLSWRLLAGNGIDDAALAALAADLAPNVAIERARPDFRALLRSAKAFVGQCGYNTAMDLIATGVRAVLVPFEQGGETEQRLRAERFAISRGAALLPEGALSAATLLATLRAQLAGPPPAPMTPRLDGAEGSVRIVERLARAR